LGASHDTADAQPDWRDRLVYSKMATIMIMHVYQKLQNQSLNRHSSTKNHTIWWQLVHNSSLGTQQQSSDQKYIF